MAGEKEIDSNEVDTTEEKAKQIGKEIGVEDNEPADDTPDYEIVEQSDDAEDERIAKPRGGERQERRALTSKEKRDLKKKKIARVISEKDETIAAQQARLDALEARFAQVDGRLSGINKAEIDNALNQTIAAFNAAEKEHAEAFTEGDGAKATLALRKMYDAQKHIDQIQVLKSQVDRPEVAPKKENSGPDPVLVNKAKKWAAKHTWYNPNGTDEDSEIAKAISGTLANEGYDPKSDEFWNELDERLKTRGIGEAEEHDEEDEDEQEERRPVQKKRSAPPTSGGSTNRADLKGKKTITLPTSYINMLKANGIYDDKKRLAKVLADRERILRESGN